MVLYVIAQFEAQEALRMDPEIQRLLRHWRPWNPVREESARISQSDYNFAAVSYYSFEICPRRLPGTPLA